MMIETSWVNSNKIKDLKQFIEKVAIYFPNLRIFSMLKNEACPNFFTGGSAEQYEQYRLFVISRLNNLQVLDSSTVSKSEREIAKKMYGSADAVPSFVIMQQQASQQNEASTSKQTKPEVNNTSGPILPTFGVLSKQPSVVTPTLVTPQQPAFNLPSMDHLQTAQQQPMYNTNQFSQQYSGYDSSSSEEDLLAAAHSIGQNFKAPTPSSNAQSGPFQLPSLDTLHQQNNSGRYY